MRLKGRRSNPINSIKKQHLSQKRDPPPNQTKRVLTSTAEKAAGKNNQVYSLFPAQEIAGGQEEKGEGEKKERGSFIEDSMLV